MTAWRLVGKVPVVLMVRYHEAHIWHVDMLMLICYYFFLAFFAVVLHSPRILWFSFPTLIPAVWLNQSDRLWVPGESLSLHSPLSQVYAFCDKLILASFRKAALSVGQPSTVSSHSSLHIKTKCTKSVENILCMRHVHTHRYMQGHTNMIIWGDINTQDTSERRMHSIP